MRWFSRLHEGPLIAGLDDEERAVLRTQLHDRNRNVARGLFPLYSAFAVLLVWINARRLQEGLFDESWVYGALMISHAVYALGIVPTLFLLVGDRVDRDLQNRALWIHIILVLSGLLGMAVLGVVERGGLVLLAVTMLISNLVYGLPYRVRMAFNGTAFAACGALIFAPDTTLGLQFVVQASELVALVSITALVGGLQNRQWVASNLAEHRLTQLAVLDTLTGVSTRRQIHDKIREQLRQQGATRALSGLLRDSEGSEEAGVLGLGSASEVERQLEILHAVSTRTKSAVVVTNVAGHVEWSNQTFLEMTGYSRSEVVGQQPGRLLQGANTDPAARRAMADAIRAREPFDQEVLNYTKEGIPYWVRVEAEPTMDAAGGFSGFVAIETDVTEARISAMKAQVTRRIGEHLLACESIDQAARLVAETLVLASDVRAAQVWTVEEGLEALRYRTGRVADPKAHPWIEHSTGLAFARGSRCTDGVGAPGVAWETGAMFTQAEELLFPEHGPSSERGDAARASGIRTLCAAPVHGPDGVIAVIEVGKTHHYPGHERLPDLMQQVARQFGAYLMQRRNLTLAEQANEELRHQIARRSEQLFSAMSNSSGDVAENSGLKPGMVLDDRYRIEDWLGQGGMGEVFRVTRLSDGTRWALKASYSTDPAMRARLAREAHLLSRIKHPNVVQVADIDVATSGFIYLVLELVDGQDLAHWRAGQESIDLAVRVDLLLQISRGLTMLHGQNIAHRDLKPQNVLVSESPSGVHAKLADFGISRLFQSQTVTGYHGSGNTMDFPDRDVVTSSVPVVDEGTAWELVRGVVEERTTESIPAAPGRAPVNPRRNVDLVVTHADAFAGTPAYLAPEILLSNDASPIVADLFGFGVLAYELLTERRPFATPPAFAVPRLQPPVPMAIGVPALEDLVGRCLSFDPSQRPSAPDVVCALEAVAVES